MFNYHYRKEQLRHHLDPLYGHATQEEINLLAEFHQQEANDQVALGNHTRLKINNKQSPLLLFIHDGATTRHETTPILENIYQQHSEWNFCQLSLPGHGGYSDKPEELNIFTEKNAREKCVKLYQTLADVFPQIHIIGISTGALLAMLLSTRKDLAYPPTSLTLVAPYVAPFLSNQFLLSISEYLKPINNTFCRSIDEVIRLTTGNIVDLNAQTFLFNKPKTLDGHEMVPLALVKQEGKLIDLLFKRIQDNQHPNGIIVNAIINQGDPYLDAKSVKTLLQQFFQHPNNHLTINEVNYPNQHCITEQLTKDYPSLFMLNNSPNTAPTQRKKH